MLKKFISLFACATVFLSGCGSNTSAPVFNVYQPVINSFATENSFHYGMGLVTDKLDRMGIGSAVEINAALPKSVDLRPQFQPVYNQGNSNACVGFATVAGLGEFLARKKGINTRFSPRFLWNIGRKNSGTLNLNMGMYFEPAIKVIDNYGMLPESEFPFPTHEQQKNKEIFQSMVSEVPTPAMIKNAKKFRISQGWKRINSLHAMRKALAEGKPVVFGMDVYNTIKKTKADGKIIVPKETDTLWGGHAILAVGYDNAKRHIIIRNSWGEEWGDKGYGYLPYEYFRKDLKQSPVYAGFTVN